MGNNVDNTGKKYLVREHYQIANEEFFDRVRQKLKLTKKQLPDKDIKKVIKLNGKLIGDWVVNNADGFQIKDNGRIVVSKYMPKCLRGDRDQKIEEIMNNPKYDDYIKNMYVSRYKKSLDYYKKRNKKGEHHINLHSFFYLYRILWFNSGNCKFDKAQLYELLPNKELKQKLNKKIIEGKDFYEYQFSDFRLKKNKYRR